MQNDKPVHQIRIGFVRAAIWKNDTSNGTMYRASFSKFYRDEKQKEWKHTESFSRDDLLVLAKVADQAHSWIYSQNQEERERERDRDERDDANSRRSGR